MRRDIRLVGSIFVALATFSLSGCGADDSASNAASNAASSTANVAANATAEPATASAGTLPAAANQGASCTLAADPALASDAITQNMQASLAADNQQVAPVMRYAPGDNANSN